MNVAIEIGAIEIETAAADHARLATVLVAITR
jgi:hypothetical protein